MAQMTTSGSVFVPSIKVGIGLPSGPGAVYGDDVHNVNDVIRDIGFIQPAFY
jgi:hypothetical protein